MVAHKKVKEFLQIPLGPKKYQGNFQAEGEEPHVAAGDIVLGSLENPVMAKRLLRAT